MHGGAVTLAGEFLSRKLKPDLLLATDMLDLTTFLALTRQETADTKTAIYFHENQLTYPWSESDRDVVNQRDMHYGFINYVSALTADLILFNSHYHLKSFSGELPGFLKSFPDNNELDTVQQILEKSKVLYLGMDLQKFDRLDMSETGSHKTGLPLILWNHRWEYDKNPEEFFTLLYRLDQAGLDFQVAVLGECFAQKPEIFLEARGKLKDKIVQFGFVNNFNEYASWLWKADIIPVTSRHDFFGASVVQALYCNCYPLLPKRFSYAEHLPDDMHSKFFYNDFEDLRKRATDLLMNIEAVRQEKIRGFVTKYDWQTMADIYDQTLESIL
jgi:glycosyltransferase involved in cell wall biosynthesis